MPLVASIPNGLGFGPLGSGVLCLVPQARHPLPRPLPGYPRGRRACLPTSAVALQGVQTVGLFASQSACLGPTVSERAPSASPAPIWLQPSMYDQDVGKGLLTYSGRYRVEGPSH